MDPTVILLTIAASVVLGVVGQSLASLTRLPAIVFLLILGLAMGSHGAGVVRSEALGPGISLLTAAFLAIILFEGGLTLRPAILKQALVPVRRLLLFGSLITLVGIAALGHYVIGMSWPAAWLFGSLLIVTGPTVVIPILRRVRLRPRLNAVLKSEGILIDAVGAITAIVVLQYVIGIFSEKADPIEAAWGMASRFGIGLLVGLACGFSVAFVAQFRFFQKRDNESLVILGALAAALGSYAISESIQSESGVMAVTVAGLLLGALPIPFREEIEKFKETLTVLGVSVLFILLAGKINPEPLFNAGWPEVLLMAGIIFLVRPASVWLSTIGTSLSWREKTYISLLAPRGILAAAMSAHFADHLRPYDAHAAQQIESLVFLTIATTVFLQGSWAGPLARLLSVRAEHPRGVLLIGVNEWSLALAEELRKHSANVLFVDRSSEKCEQARERGHEAVEDDATEPDTYDKLDMATIGIAIAMTPNDATNTLACEAASHWLGIKHVFQIRSKPPRDARRSKVRMAGRWAMPTELSHLAVCSLVRSEHLHLSEVPLVENTLMSSRFLTAVEHGAASDPTPTFVPLIVLQHNSWRLAVDGQAYPAGSKVLGFSRRQHVAAEESFDAASL